LRNVISETATINNIITHHMTTSPSKPSMAAGRKHL
jgi:hypothetical protein